MSPGRYCIRLSRVFASAVGPRHDVQVPVAGEFPHRSVSFGRNDGGGAEEPLVPVRRRVIADRDAREQVLVLMSGHHESGRVDQEQHAAREAPDVCQGQVRSALDLLPQVPA